MSNFKNITGGEAVSAKRLYKDGFNFNYTGLSIVTANSPALYGAGSWFKRRARVVHMNFQPQAQQNLMVKFIPEIAAFTRYLLSITNDEIYLTRVRNVISRVALRRSICRRLESLRCFTALRFVQHDKVYILPISSIDRVLRDQHSASGGVTPAFWEVAVRQDSIAVWVEECIVFDETAFTQVGKNKDEWKDKDYNPYVSTLFGSYHHYCRG